MEQKITFKMTSLDDDKTYTLPVSEALQKIIKIMDEEKKMDFY